MEVCQHCGMYMRPFVGNKFAECEFCGETIAIKREGKWNKVTFEDLQELSSEKYG